MNGATLLLPLRLDGLRVVSLTFSLTYEKKGLCGYDVGSVMLQLPVRVIGTVWKC